MQTRLSSKGQVVLPSPLRNRLGIRPGDPLDAAIENGRIVLTPSKKRGARVKIVADEATGLPVLSAGPGTPLLRTDEVKEILTVFP
jgi:AbrB family looped-hinge helix DNA binding protein